MDYTITNEGWELGASKPDFNVGYVPAKVAPFISEPASWEQYSDFELYTLEKLLRDWLETMKENKKWMRSTKFRRYTYKQIWEILLRRPYDTKADVKFVNRMSKLLAYYSTKIQQSATINGKRYNKTVYTLSAARLKMPPYSLKYRFEWMCEQGIVPDNVNMRLPKDNLTIGHARNPRTERNMEKHREEGRRKYNEWKRNHIAKTEQTDKE